MRIANNPDYPPHVCIICGLSNNRRWFVNLDVNLDRYYNPIQEGQLWFCDECWTNLVTDTARHAQAFMEGKDLTENNGSGKSITDTEPVDSGPDTNNSDTESNDPESESDVGVPEPASGFKEFRGFFSGTRTE